MAKSVLVVRGHHSEERKKRLLIHLDHQTEEHQDYARSLHKCHAPCSIIITTQKLKTTLPSLKQPVEKHLQSEVVYQVECARCQAAYVRQTA